MASKYYPAIRGVFGDWVYYTSVMPIADAAEKISYVTDVHKNNSLSDMMQRNIDKDRENDIYNYLIKNNQRFFNSLVLAVYGDNPNWYPASISPVESSDKIEITGDVGLLEFRGNDYEKIIPIDGQHRLSGIKHLIEKYKLNEAVPGKDYPFTEDIIPVIFVSHKKDTEEGMLRTRRLFTTLNKYAVKVNKYEIISLDEDDPMAIVTRWLLENDERFSEGRIKIKGGSNINIDDSCWTSIENLYDILSILFTKIFDNIAYKKLANMKRPSDFQLEKYKKYTLEYFNHLSSTFYDVKELFDNENYGEICVKKRMDGNLLYRPIGLKLIANLISRIKQGNLYDRFSKIKNIPLDLKKKPYANLLMDEQGKMLDSNETKIRNLILSSLNIPLNATDKKSAKSGIAIITGMQMSAIHDFYLPNNLDELRNLGGKQKI